MLTNLKIIISQWFRDALRTVGVMFKIMIPITILVKILQETGLIKYIGMALSPLMELTGLPGEMGLVWASSIIANIYGGLITYFSLSADVQLTVAQVSVLATMILIAHTFPIELTVARKAGVKVLPMFILRFFGGLIAGILLNQIYRIFGVLNDVPIATKVLEAPKDPTWLQWFLNEVKNYALIFCWIFALIVTMDILKRIKIIDLINRLLEPVLGILGIGKSAIPITVIGLTLGLAYGGALIIHNAQHGEISKRDVFYSLSLMGLCHSIIEDSLLMISIGGHYTGVFIFRIIFALLISFLIVKFTKNKSESWMQKYFYAKEK